MPHEMPILQVEDDENDVFLLAHAFNKAGVGQPIKVARDGQEAVDYISGQGRFSDREAFPIPCLIILDLKMPRKNGIEFLQWLRRESPFPKLPVLMLSSSANTDDVDRAYDAGVNAFLVKPASNSERVRMAAAIKHFWIDFNLLPPKAQDFGRQSGKADGV